MNGELQVIDFGVTEMLQLGQRGVDDRLAVVLMYFFQLLLYTGLAGLLLYLFGFKEFTLNLAEVLAQ